MMRTEKERENRLSAYIDSMNEGRLSERSAEDDDELRDLMDTTLRLRALKGTESASFGFAERVAQRLREEQAKAAAQEAEWVVGQEAATNAPMDQSQRARPRLLDWPSFVKAIFRRLARKQE